MYKRAPFIWIPEQKTDSYVTFRKLLREGPIRRNDGMNRWYLFRYEFELSDVPQESVVRITTDGRYKLFINGNMVSRGPARSSPAYQRYDRRNVNEYLNLGTNVLGVLVHVYGCDMAWYETAKDYWQNVFGDGALWLEFDIKCENNEIFIPTSSKWKCLECKAWRNDTPRTGWGQDFIEDFNANKMPEGWNLPGFDDSDWKNAKELKVKTGKDKNAIGFGAIEPFPTLLSSDIPVMVEDSVKPEKIIGIYGVKPEPNLPIDRRIFEEVLTTPIQGQIENPDSMLKEDNKSTLLKTTDKLDISVLVVFNKRHAGYPFIELEGKGGEVVEIAVAETIPGEYTNNGQDIPRLSRKTYLDSAHLFRYTARAGFQRFEKFEWTAVKYMQIVVRNASSGLKIHRVGSVHTHYPVENRGSFICSDEFLNTLHKIGRYTTQECTHDAWEDCPSREKRQWFGDGIVHYLVNAVVFGPSTLSVDRQFIMAGAESQRPDGLIQMFAPGDHHTNSIIIPDFNLHWILMIYYYMMHTGDFNTVEKVFPSIQRSLYWFQRQIGPSGLLSNIPYWHFIEWANVERKGDSAIINAIYVGALKAAGNMADYLGYSRASSKYNELARMIKNKLNSLFWDSNRKVYIDSINPETYEQNIRVSQHTNASFILWDIAPKDRWPAIVRYITDPSRMKLTIAPPMVTKGADFNPYADVVKTNTYFSHFLYSALAKAGRFDKAIQIMRRDYGQMLKTGTETLWESFVPVGSMCHAFSCSPVYQLSAHALGIQPLKPGFSLFECAPQIGDLTYANGIYPTVKGDIAVSWKHEQKSFIILKINVPPGSCCKLIAPDGFYLPAEEKDILMSGQHKIVFLPVE